jgi:cyclopropane-fatty-acyl-phospholipid synthase
MNPIAAVASAVERLPLPDRLNRAAIALLVDRTHRRLERHDPKDEAAFAEAMASYPIAEHTADANAQHYELPPDFFTLILGPQRKYSCCLYDGETTLAMAEERALRATAANAGLANGQRILELGCGWGALTLWMAKRYPAATIVAVSNSRPQRWFIEAEAARRGLRNLRVETADMNAFDAAARFDRVVSVEMFEHMSNWAALLGRVRDWLDPQGRVFLHIFSHRAMPYRFDRGDKADWIAQHFFTGGIMPSHGLIHRLSTPFEVEAEWRWSGTHYRRTAEDWLANYDANAASITVILRQVYGAAAPLWHRRWRLFFLATAGLFGACDGAAWGVSHYRLRPR